MAHKEMKAELTCPICMELFRQPRRLPCGHAYCHRCITTLLQVRAQQQLLSSRRLVCPECRDDVRVDYILGIEALPIDFKLSRLVELIRSMEGNSSSGSCSDTESPSPVQESPESRPPVTASPIASSTASPTVPASSSPTVPALSSLTVPALSSPTVPALSSPTLPALSSPTVPALSSPTVPVSSSSLSPSTPSLSSPTRSSSPPIPPMTIIPGLPNSGYYFIGPDGEPFTVAIPPGFELFPGFEDNGQDDDEDLLAPLPRNEYDDYLDTLSYSELWNEASVALNSLLDSVQTNRTRIENTSSERDSTERRPSLSSSSSSSFEPLRTGALSPLSSVSSNGEHSSIHWSSTPAADSDDENNGTSLNHNATNSSESVRDNDEPVQLPTLPPSAPRDNVELNAEMRNGNDMQNETTHENVDSNNETRNRSENARENDFVLLFSEGQRSGGTEDIERLNARAFREFLQFRNRLPQFERSSEPNPNGDNRTENNDSNVLSRSSGKSEEKNEGDMKGKDNFKIKYLKLKKRVVNIFKDSYSTTESSDEEIELERERQRERDRKKEEEEREKRRLSAHQQKCNRERRRWRMTRRLMSLILSDDSSSSEDELNRHDSRSRAVKHRTGDGLSADSNTDNSSRHDRPRTSRENQKKTSYGSADEVVNGNRNSENEDMGTFRRSTNALIALSLGSSSNASWNGRMTSPPQEAYPVPSIPPLISTYDNISTTQNLIEDSSNNSTALDTQAEPSNVESEYENTPAEQCDGNPNLLSLGPLPVTQPNENIAIAEMPMVTNISQSSQQEVGTGLNGSNGVEIARRRLISENESGGTFYDNICEEEISMAIGQEDAMNRIGEESYDNSFLENAAIRTEIEDLKTGLEDGTNDSAVLESTLTSSLYNEGESMDMLALHRELNPRSVREKVNGEYEIDSLKEEIRGNETTDDMSTGVKEVVNANTSPSDWATQQQHGARQQLEEAKVFRLSGIGTSLHPTCALSLYDNVRGRGSSREIRNPQFGDGLVRGVGHGIALGKCPERSQQADGSLGKEDGHRNDNTLTAASSVIAAQASAAVPLSSPEATENTKAFGGEVENNNRVGNVNNNKEDDDSDLETAAAHSAMLKYSSGAGMGSGKKPKSRFRKFISSLMWVSSSSSDEDPGADGDCSDF